MSRTATRRTLQSPVTRELRPGYWLAFDGADDIITLPSGHGQEPTTALFVEAWVKDLLADDASHEIVGRGNFYDDGYAFIVTRFAGPYSAMRLALDTTTGDYVTATNFDGTDVFFGDLPIHVAAGWDGTTIYYFVNGMLLATASKDGTLEYTGSEWLIGAMPGPVWLYNAKLGGLRISNICRHTTSFDPSAPSAWTPDAYTIGLWRNTDGAGTTLTDASGNTHNGTFKGAGEPAWVAGAIDYTLLAHGQAIWDAVLGVLPNVTGNVWVKRISADEYHLFKQIHSAGYWAKYVLFRNAATYDALALQGAYVGQTSTNDPSTWAADPATALMLSGSNEYVFEGRISGGSDVQWGNTHGYEVLVSEGLYVDGTLTTLGNGDYDSGSVIEWRATLTYSDDATLICNVARAMTLKSSALYIEGTYRFDWQVDWTPTRQLYPVMTLYDTNNVNTFTYVPGGSDIAIDGLHDNLRTHAGAAWKSDNGCIMATWISLRDGLRYGTTGGARLDSTFRKLYLVRTREVDAAKAGTSWAYTARWLALDNCGNHFLKTT